MTDDEILAARAMQLARPLEVAVEGRPAIVVQIGAQHYAFPLADVRRAAFVGPLTVLPHVPPIVLGLGAIDGNVVAVFDAAVWAGGSARSQLDRVPILLLGTIAEPLVLAVDAFVDSVVLSTGSQLITESGVLVVDVAALLHDPAFSPGTVPLDGVADDHH